MTENSPEKSKAVAPSKQPAAAKTAAAKKPASAKTTAKPATAKAAVSKPAASQPATAKKPAAIESAAALPAPVAPPVAPPVAAPVPPVAPPIPPMAPPAPAPMLESDARMWAMLLHVLAAVAIVISAGTLAFLVPLVIWLMHRDRSALIDHHGKQNLNLQLTSILVIVVGTVIGLITLGFGFLLTGPLMLGYGIYALVISLVAGGRAHSGEYYAIPAMIRFIR